MSKKTQKKKFSKPEVQTASILVPSLFATHSCPPGFTASHGPNGEQICTEDPVDPG